MLKTYKTKDEIPKADQEKAIEAKDGSFLVDEPDKTADDVTKLQQALDKERSAREKEEADRKKAEKDLADEKRNKSAKEKGITEEQLNAIREEDRKAREPLEKKVEELTLENTDLKLTQVKKQAFLDGGVIKERLTQAMKLSVDRVELSKDGKTHVVKDEHGNITSETLENFTKVTFKKENPFLYEGTGSGNPRERGPAGEVPEASDETKTRQIIATRGAF